MSRSCERDTSVDGLSRLLDLGFLLQQHGITLSRGPHGRRPWLHHALMGDGFLSADTGDARSTARLSDAFIQAHSRPTA